MKLRNLFYLLLALPLVFAACEKGSEDVDDKPAPEKEYAAELTLTSEATMEVAAEAGDYEITYTAKMVEVTRTSPVPEPEVEATCAADWVTIGEVTDTKAAFSVAANEGEAREAKIVVKYSTESFEVTVKQAAKEQGEQPKEPVACEAVAFAGFYEAGVEEGVDNWFIRLADKPFTAEGALDPAANVYAVDLYLAAYEGEWSETMTLPAGEYNLNAEDSIVAGTFGSKTSGYMAAGAETVSFEAGKLVVTEAGLTLTATIDGVEHTVTYEGAMSVVNDSEKPVVVTEITFELAKASYYGDVYAPGVADNYYFFFSDMGWDEYDWEVANGKYYRFDIYTELVDKANGLAIPYGTYELKPEVFAPGAIAEARYFSVDEYGYDWVEDESMTEATVTFSETGVVANVVIAGQAYKLVYEGEYPVVDNAVTPSSGLELNITDATLILADYEDYYENGTHSWTVYVYENLEEESGAYLMFEILTAGDATNIAGEYTFDDSKAAYTGFTGYVDGEEDYYGSWYVNMDTYEMIPFAGGSISIDIAEDGTYTITLNGIDDADGAITGTIVGTLDGADEGGEDPGVSYEDWSFTMQLALFTTGELTLTGADGGPVVTCVLATNNESGKLTEGTYQVNDPTAILYAKDIAVDGVPATEASGTIRITGAYKIEVDMTIDGVKYTGLSTNSLLG